MKKTYTSKNEYSVTYTKKEFNQIRLLLEELNICAALAPLNLSAVYEGKPIDLEAFKEVNKHLQNEISDILDRLMYP